MGFVPFVPFPSLTLFIPVALLPSVLSSNLGGKVAGPGATFSKSAQKKPPKSPWVGLMRMQWLNAARACQSIAIALHALRVATNYRFMLRPLKIWKKIHLRKCRFWSFLVWNWDLTTSTHVALTDGKCWCLLCAHGVSHPDPHFPPPWSTLHVRLRIARGKHGGCQRTTIATPKALWVLWHLVPRPKAQMRLWGKVRHWDSPCGKPLGVTPLFHWYQTNLIWPKPQSKSYIGIGQLKFVHPAGVQYPYWQDDARWMIMAPWHYGWSWHISW